ncbi:pre-mRNA-splicing factor SYF2-like [Littorina saxatilis]|uniref:Pre-mRNA-splicing factor SYF2 n=1 Tax=Littorina saxatilis TaxID=31220 RepID=A0AAN9GFG7_9CAEN
MADKEDAATAGPSGSSTGSAPAKMSRLNRLRDLELRMNEARKMNNREAAAEEDRKKRPENWEAKRKRSEWEEEQDRLKKHCQETGEDFNLVKLRDLGADEVERWERKKAKKNPDVGFADYEQATHRQYQRLTKQMKPDLTQYERQRERMGEEFYATANTLGLHQRKDPEDNVDKMVTDLEKQIEKRQKYSRRRRFDEEEDVSYINERNMKFNKKLERFYGEYTAEIKQNLERGTAV